MRSAITGWKPFQTLPSRIVALVLAATLLTSLVVTWVSTQSLHDFLRAHIDEKFPVLLNSTSERLAVWYAKRQLDVETFAQERSK